jgi:hypothetical protein
MANISDQLLKRTISINLSNLINIKLNTLYINLIIKQHPRTRSTRQVYVFAETY